MDFVRSFLLVAVCSLHLETGTDYVTSDFTWYALSDTLLVTLHAKRHLLYTPHPPPSVVLGFDVAFGVSCTTGGPFRGRGGERDGQGERSR